MTLALHLWSTFLAPCLDILLLAFLLYRILLLIKGTASAQVVIGLVVLMVFTIAVRSIRLTATSRVLEIFWSSAVILLAIVFQPELRTVLAQLGTHPLGRIIVPTHPGFIDEIVGAVSDAMQRQMGMLLVLEEEVGLRNYAETGTMINGELSKELLLAIFHHRSPLHDGAALIQKDRLVAAGCLLPLSNDPSLAKILGTRHRAAVGLSEFTDAWVIVVSEETGSLSLARGGRLQRELNPEQLSVLLREHTEERAQKISRPLSQSTKDA